MTVVSESISWRDRWRRLKLAHCAVPNYGNSSQFWNDKTNVQTVYLRGREKHQHLTDARLAAMDIPTGSRVLDIGSGPGTYAIPLAERGCHVTAVEPSPVMREVLEERLAENPGLDVAIIPQRWEDVTMAELGGPFDVVFASYSLTMIDIAEAVAKMQVCCMGTVHLFWFLTSPPWVNVKRDLWPLLHDGEIPGQATADWLWQILIEMGIYANLTVETKFPPAIFESVEDAVSDYLVRLNCTTEVQKQTVANYFTSVLRPSKAGYILDGETLGAHIWWRVAPIQPNDERHYARSQVEE